MKPAGTLLIVTLLLATHMLAGRAAAECIVPPAGLVTSWPGNGSTADTESGFDGTLVSGANFAPGFDAQAFHFDGVGGERDDRVDLPNQALDGLEDLTVDLWVNTTDRNGAVLSGANASKDNEFLLFPRGSVFWWL